MKATIVRKDSEGCAVKIADMHSACKFQVNDKVINILEIEKTYLFQNVVVKRYYVFNRKMYLDLSRRSKIMMTSDTFSELFIDTETQLYQLYQLDPDTHMMAIMLA